MNNLAEAYRLCQKRSSLVMGGMAWLKATNMTEHTIVDLSGPGLDQIGEAGEEFRTEYVSTLCQVETHQGLNQYFGGIFRECACHIVGMQMHNCTAVEGSIYGRFDFSDILTCMMTLDTYVKLYHGGIMPLPEFTKRPVRRDDKDILIRMIIKEDRRKAAYTTQRSSSTDFPPLVCCVSRRGSNWYTTVGAKLSKVWVVTVTDDGYGSLVQLTRKTADSFIYSINTRGSSRYRRQLTPVYIRRLMERLTGRSATIG